MSDTSQYLNNTQQNMLKVILALAGHEVSGLSAGDVAQRSSLKPATVTKTLANLQHAGWAEKMTDTGRWRLGPKLVQIALAYSTAVDRAQTRLAEVQHNYSRTPN